MQDKELTIPELKKECIDSLAYFTYLFQGDEWFDPVHLELCDFLQKGVEDSENKEVDCKMRITMPRGSLKTTIVSKYFPIWMTLRDPNFRTLIATNTHPNARKKVRDVASMFESEELFQQLFPELLPTVKCKWSDEYLEINRPKAFADGTVEGCGLRTKKTGSHFNMIIEDDTTAPDEKPGQELIMTPSIEEIEKSVSWHKGATPLLVPKGGRYRIIVSTRWAEFDLINYITENEPGYLFFDVPARKENGERIFTTMYSEEQLDDIESQLGPYLFSALYLNNPLDASKKTFQDKWFKYVNKSDIPLESWNTIAIDPAISEKDGACETAITKVWHYMDSNKRECQYWSDAVHGKFNPFETINESLNLVDENTKAIIFEDVAYQKSLQYYLNDAIIEKDFDRTPQVIPFASRSSKEVRIEGLVPWFASGRIYMVKGISGGVEDQLRQYPHGRLVDIIDSFAMHYKAYKGDRRVRKYYNSPGVDPNTFEGAMSELDNKSNGKGVLGYMIEPRPLNFNGIKTGLGDGFDIPIMLGRSTRK